MTVSRPFNGSTRTILLILALLGAGVGGRESWRITGGPAMNEDLLSRIHSLELCVSSMNQAKLELDKDLYQRLARLETKVDILLEKQNLRDK